MKKGLIAPLTALGLLASLNAASAHLGLTLPVSRYGPNVLKQGPCGIANGERSDHVTVFQPGETILVQWEEYVDHPGHYRIAFDPDGDDDFVDPATMNELYSNDTVLLDGIDDEADTDPYYEVSVQLPNIECERCTLQVIQVMYDKPPYVVPGNDIYYQCADLALRCSGGPGSCSKGSAGGTAGSDGGAAGAGGGWEAGHCADQDEDGGCKEGGSCALGPGRPGTEHAWLGWLLAVAATLGYRRRRRSRPKK